MILRLFLYMVFVISNFIETIIAKIFERVSPRVSALMNIDYLIKAAPHT